mmetsp:Transcript_36663/g.47356  ORF Transcript_36663/g.47356 Transcript_36663/m.47356 type:complete len:247 (+) Transcript_36663:1386-2126(+)
MEDLENLSSLLVVQQSLLLPLHFNQLQCPQLNRSMPQLLCQHQNPLSRLHHYQLFNRHQLQQQSLFSPRPLYRQLSRLERLPQSLLFLLQSNRQRCQRQCHSLNQQQHQHHCLHTHLLHCLLLNQLHSQHHNQLLYQHISQPPYQLFSPLHFQLLSQPNYQRLYQVHYQQFVQHQYLDFYQHLFQHSFQHQFQVNNQLLCPHLSRQQPPLLYPHQHQVYCHLHFRHCNQLHHQQHCLHQDRVLFQL